MLIKKRLDLGRLNRGVMTLLTIPLPMPFALSSTYVFLITLGRFSGGFAPLYAREEERPQLNAKHVACKRCY